MTDTKSASHAIFPIDLGQVLLQSNGSKWANLGTHTTPGTGNGFNYRLVSGMGHPRYSSEK